MQITKGRMIRMTLGAATVAAAVAFGYVTGASAQQDFSPRVYERGPVLTGSDIGFQLISPNSRTGYLVIRVDGNWVPAQFLQLETSGIRPLTDTAP